MRFFLFFTVLIIGTISCSKKIDYQKTIQAIEANDNLFELNYELRGKMNVFYKRIQYFVNLSGTDSHGLWCTAGTGLSGAALVNIILRRRLNGRV